MLAKVTSANRERTLDDPRSPTLALANSRGGHPRPRHQSVVRVANRRRLASRGRPQFHLSGTQPQSRHRVWCFRGFAIHRHADCLDSRLSGRHRRASLVVCRGSKQRPVNRGRSRTFARRGHRQCNRSHRSRGGHRLLRSLARQLPLARLQCRRFCNHHRRGPHHYRRTLLPQTPSPRSQQSPSKLTPFWLRCRRAVAIPSDLPETRTPVIAEGNWPVRVAGFLLGAIFAYRDGRLASADDAAAAAAFCGGRSVLAGAAAWPLTPEDVALGLTGSGISSFLRSAVSSLSRMSLFSFRKTRAFSRPWPMRSPPKLIHVPLFSSTPFSTPRSIKSPSREIPSPYTMSNSASRNGAATLSPSLIA